MVNLDDYKRGDLVDVRLADGTWVACVVKRGTDFVPGYVIAHALVGKGVYGIDQDIIEQIRRTSDVNTADRASTLGTTQRA